MFQGHGRRMSERIVMPDHFQAAAVAGALLFDHNDAIKRLFFGAKSRQANHEHIYKLSAISFQHNPGSNLRERLLMAGSVTGFPSRDREGAVP